MGSRFPELVEEIRGIRADFVADGELVILDRQGRPEWSRLKKRHALRDPRRISEAAATDPAAIFAFDLLSLNGADFRSRSLLDRKAALYRTLPANRGVRYARHVNDSCAEIWAMANEMELEGIVAKDGASVYTPGRTTRWLKIKTAIGAERERNRRRMAENNLMLQAAMNRLEYWQAALVSTTNGNDSAKMCECARFIEEYGLLIQQMTCSASSPPT